jgi:hypothetical protein
MSRQLKIWNNEITESETGTTILPLLNMVSTDPDFNQNHKSFHRCKIRNIVSVSVNGNRCNVRKRVNTDCLSIFMAQSLLADSRLRRPRQFCGNVCGALQNINLI